MLDVTQQPRQLLFTWPGWRLLFEWQQDRWRHALEQAVAGKWRQQFASVEGGTDPSWPACPAFQYAQVERIGESCAEIQLLGQAGKNHYSGAVRCDAEHQLLDFDLAVRIQQPPPNPLILSTYEGPQSSPDAAEQPGGGPTKAQKNWELTIEELPDQPVCTVQQPSDSAIGLTMTDLPVWQTHKPRITLRWKYQFQLKPVA